MWMQHNLLQNLDCSCFFYDEAVKRFFSYLLLGYRLLTDRSSFISWPSSVHSTIVTQTLAVAHHSAVTLLPKIQVSHQHKGTKTWEKKISVAFKSEWDPSHHFKKVKIQFSFSFPRGWFQCLYNLSFFIVLLAVLKGSYIMKNVIQLERSGSDW